jgi:hypothetical protein
MNTDSKHGDEIQDGMRAASVSACQSVAVLTISH